MKKDSISIAGRDISKLNIATALLAIFHLVGVVGLSSPALREIFQALTPFNLLLSIGLLFWLHRDFSKQFLAFALITYLIGYWIEVAGVYTGQIFGEYSYGPTLGFQLLEVPLIIGINWLLLGYITGEIAQRATKVKWLAAIYGAFLMVVLDYLIEPVAIKLDFWTWSGGDIPFQNYLSWFLVAFVIQLIYQYLSFEKTNKLAPRLFLIEVLFFVILNFLLVN
ncbi:carotenoid biosynthesis protein [Penaeicola halotolerans]|uniref:carotenoid biosynthesis protein n=1 Tax=Penaeicola halotolerans TaxID=2793196 RepID=UPI001CF8CECC|nr:carotenoid biosynthesis protein [Penaeicola halotolerans]